MDTKPRAPVLHNAIERDNRMHWHPIVELRHKGVLIYAVAAVKGYLQPARAAAHAAREVEALLRG